MDKIIAENTKNEFEEFNSIHDLELFIDEVALSLMPDMYASQMNDFRNSSMSRHEIETLVADRCYSQALEMAKAKVKYNSYFASEFDIEE